MDNDHFAVHAQAQAAQAQAQILRRDSLVSILKGFCACILTSRYIICHPYIGRPKSGFTQDDVGIENSDLSDLAEVLCNKNERLKELKARPNKLEFFGEASSGECCGTAVRMTRAVRTPSPRHPRQTFEDIRRVSPRRQISAV